MAAITPEKVKNLLSSFILSPEAAQSSQNDATPKRKRAGKCVDNQGDGGSGKKASCLNSLRSYDNFLQRVDTFSSLTWFSKPAELNPLLCARYGWENVEADMLQCVGCKAFLCAKLPDRGDAQAYESSVKKLKENLLTAHDKFCVLAINPCPESFCRVPLDDPANLTSMFMERVSGLAQIQDQLPVIDFSSLHQFSYEEGQGAAYCKNHYPSLGDLSPQAVTLAFTGWTARSKDVLVCCLCRRQVGLWNYGRMNSRGLPDSTTPDSEDEEREDGSGEPSVKKRRFKVCRKEKFCPVEEHRHWCPWVRELGTAVSQNSQSAVSSPQKSLPAPKCPQPPYITAIKVIAPGLIDNNTGLAQALKTSPMVDGLRCFRRVIKSWSSPKVKSPEKSPQTTPVTTPVTTPRTTPQPNPVSNLTQKTSKPNTNNVSTVKAKSQPVNLNSIHFWKASPNVVQRNVKIYGKAPF